MTIECSNADFRYIDLAATEATKSNALYRHGCIAVSSGKIIAKGYNKYRTYSKDGLIPETCSCHAEIDVLRKCNKLPEKNKISIYVVRLSEGDNLSNSTPCQQCVDTMKDFGIKKIIYSHKNGVIEKHNLKDFCSNVKTSGQIIYENYNENPVNLYMKSTT